MFVLAGISEQNISCKLWNENCRFFFFLIDGCFLYEFAILTHKSHFHKLAFASLSFLQAFKVASMGFVLYVIPIRTTKWGRLIWERGIAVKDRLQLGFPNITETLLIFTVFVWCIQYFLFRYQGICGHCCSFIFVSLTGSSHYIIIYMLAHPGY